MTYLWRYRITCMHRIRVTERAGVRLPASPSPRSPRRLKNGRSSPRRTSAKNGVTTAKKPSFTAISAIDCECPKPCRCMTTGTSKTCQWKRRFSQRAATVRSRLSPPRRHLRNLHDTHTWDVDHLIHEQLGNLYGFLNSPDYEDHLCVTTGMSTTTPEQRHGPPNVKEQLGNLYV